MRHLHIDIALRLEQFNLSVNEEIPMSGITGLFGASGSGKTTLLRIIAGLETRATGQLKLGDTHWQSGGHVLPAHRRRGRCSAI